MQKLEKKGRNNMRKQIALLLVLAMMVCIFPSVYAADTAQPQVALDVVFEETNVRVTVRLEHVANVTNGRLTLRYDDEEAKLLEVETSPDLPLPSVNRTSSTEVSIAWVGSSFTKEGATLASLVFEPLEEQDLHFAAGCSELFAGKESLSAKSTKAFIAWNPFTDIEGHWAEDEILEGWHRGIIQGVSDTLFQPDGKLSRGMFVTILHRMAGSPAAKLPCGFNDVSSGRYYEKAVNWAVEVGITDGVGYGQFQPHKHISRQEMITMLYRYAEAMNLDTTADEVIAQFSDAAKVSPWAVDAMNWAVDNGIIHGMTETRLAPAATSTRAQVVTMLCRFLAE